LLEIVKGRSLRAEAARAVGYANDGLDAGLRGPSDRRVGRCGFKRSTMRVESCAPASCMPHSPTSRLSSWVSPGKLDMPLPRLHAGES